MDIEYQIEMMIDCQIKESKLQNVKKAQLLEQIINIKAPSGIHKTGRNCDVISKNDVPLTDKVRKGIIVKVGTKPS